jgi:hypothetical protein
MDNNVIALFQFEDTNEGIRISFEKHYQLVAPNELTEEEIINYRNQFI